MTQVSVRPHFAVFAHYVDGITLFRLTFAHVESDGTVVGVP